MQQERNTTDPVDRKNEKKDYRPLEYSLYVICAGAFGLFLRWMQVMLAFNEDGLPDPSAFHVMLPGYLLICALVFRSFVRRIERENCEIPSEFPAAFSNGLTAVQLKNNVMDVNIYGPVRWLIGAAMAVGGIVLLMTTELNKYAGMLRVMSFTAILAGITFPLLMEGGNKPGAKKDPLCVFAFLPIFLYAVWLVFCYRANSINGVVWSYVLEVAAVIMAMLAFFRLAGFVFDNPNPRRCLFDAMFSACLCITSLADGSLHHFDTDPNQRYLGMQIILFATAMMLVFVVWVMVKNRRQRAEKAEEPAPAPGTDDGFERL